MDRLIKMFKMLQRSDKIKEVIFNRVEFLCSDENEMYELFSTIDELKYSYDLIETQINKYPSPNSSKDSDPLFVALFLDKILERNANSTAIPEFKESCLKTLITIEDVLLK